MQTFKTKAFARFADREGLEDAALCEAVRRAREGLIDADLGGGVIKQLLAGEYLALDETGLVAAQARWSDCRGRMR